MLAACTTAGPIVRTPPPDPKTQMAALELRIYELVERARETTDPKAQPLSLDSELTAVARAHSADMAAKHYMAHKAPDGQTSATIIMARDADFQGLLGENIAAQYYTKAGGVDVDSYAKRFVETWMKSKTHRDNLAFPDYDRTGVGAAVDGNMVYVTQLFAAELPRKTPASPAPDQSGDARKDGRTVAMYPDPRSAKASQPPIHHVRLRGQTGLGTLPDERRQEPGQ